MRCRAGQKHDLVARHAKGNVLALSDLDFSALCDFGRTNSTQPRRATRLESGEKSLPGLGRLFDLNILGSVDPHPLAFVLPGSSAQRAFNRLLDLISLASSFLGVRGSVAGFVDSGLGLLIFPDFAGLWVMGGETRRLGSHGWQGWKKFPSYYQGRGGLAWACMGSALLRPRCFGWFEGLRFMRMCFIHQIHLNGNAV